MEFKPPCAFYEREKQIIKSVFEPRTKSPASPRPTPKGHSRRSNAYPPSRRLRPRVVPTPPTRPLARRAHARMRYFSRDRAHTHRTSRARPAVDRRRHAERVRRHLAVLGERAHAFTKYSEMSSNALGVTTKIDGGACAPSASIAVAARPPIKSFFNSTIVVRASFARRRRRRGRVEECRQRRDARRFGTPSVAKGRPLVTLRIQASQG